MYPETFFSWLRPARTSRWCMATFMVFVALSSVAASGPTPAFSWVRQIIGGEDDFSSGIAVDAEGSCYVTGSFYSGFLSFGTITLTNRGSADAFVAKFDRTGNPVWAKQWGGIGYDGGRSIALDTAGTCYVTGFFQATVDFGGTNLTSHGSGDLFVAKLDSSGNLLWVSREGATGGEAPEGIAIDAAGNCYVTGFFFSSTNTTFGSFTLTNRAFILPGNGKEDAFLVKYDSAGNVQWAQQLGSINYGYGLGIGADAAGNVFVTGSIESPAIFGSTTLTSSIPSRNIFLAKYDTAGNFLWVKEAGGKGTDTGTLGNYGTDVAVDGAGNIYLSGFFSSTNAHFGDITLTNLQKVDTFLVKHDSSGNVLWARSGGGAGEDRAAGVVVDTQGNSYLAGFFRSTVATFGTIMLTNKSSATPGPTGTTRDFFLVKYDSEGNVLWARQTGGTEDDFNVGAAVDAVENVYVTGTFFSSQISFGNTNLNTSGRTDIFIAKLGTVTPPKLNVRKSADGLELSWPALASEFYLELTESMAPTMTWTSNAVSPTVLSGSNVVVLPLVGETKYFRLRRP